MGTIDADYLVVGAGATAMAFVDILASETAASVVVVDRNHRPGPAAFQRANDTGHANARPDLIELQRPKLVGHERGRALFTKPEFRIPVNVASNLDDGRVELSRQCFGASA